MEHVIKKGYPIQINWTLHSIAGEEFSLQGYMTRLYYANGSYASPATGVTFSGNTLTWSFTPTTQWKTGDYDIFLELYSSGTKIITLHYPKAFALWDRQTNINDQSTVVQSSATTINITSSCDFYRFAPVVPVVGDDGYWYVNGQKVTDGSGEFVLSSHTLEYDAETGYLIIDRGRVDSEGHSIQQTITDIAAIVADLEDKDAEIAQNIAQYAASETGRVSAESLRVAAEASRASAEAARATAETARASAESSRASAESARASAENARASAESSRATAETSRATAETARKNAETARASAESSRATAETARASAETSRASAELARASAEADRVEQAAGDHSTAVADHSQASTDHSTAASDHTQASQDHTIAASDHTQAASDHTTAAADHTQAASDHTQAASDHTTAAADHTQAGTDHTTAASDHTQAASDHTTAEADHALYEADHAVMQGYDDRLTDVEGDVSQLALEVKNQYISGYTPKLYIYGSSSTFSIRYNENWVLTEKIPAKNGDVVKIVFNRTGASNYNLLAAFDANDTILGAFSSSSYTNVRDNMTINNANCTHIRCCLDYANIANGAVYINGKQVWKYAAPTTHTIDERLTTIEKGRQYRDAFLDDLVQASISSGLPSPASSSAPYRVTQNSALCFPEKGTYIVHVPYGLNIAVESFNSSVGSIVDSGWLKDGDTVTVSEKSVYRITFRVGSGNSSLPVAYMSELVRDGRIRLSIYNNEDDIILRNLHREAERQALVRVLVSSAQDNEAASLPLFAHISDVHGDAARLENCLSYCDDVKPLALLNSGDAVIYRGDNDKSTYQVALAKRHSTDYLFCIGNHEANPTGQSDVYAKHMQSLATEYDYLSAADTVSTECYYYKDYDAAKIRIIALNYYDAGTYAGRLGQSQITWFCQMLASTPAGYGILVMLHSPEDYVDPAEGYDTFYRKKSILGAMAGIYVGGRIIMKIIDAFISRSSISESYTESNSDVVNVSANFSSVDETTEFIAYITGHRHEDQIGYYRDSTNKQLCLCVTAGIALYGDSTNAAWANQADLPRGGIGVSQDAFNLYAIDRINGNVKVMRIGACVTENMEERKTLVIPYKD